VDTDRAKQAAIDFPPPSLPDFDPDGTDTLSVEMCEAAQSDWLTSNSWQNTLLPNMKPNCLSWWNRRPHAGQ
jgi:hypothetical protein